MQCDLQLATESGNSITRLSETYNNPTPVVYTAATAQQFRFPLTHFKNDFWSLENGIWPGEKAQKSYLEIYWEVPAYCIYAQGAIEGSSFSFAYSVSGFNLQIVQVTDRAPLSHQLPGVVLVPATDAAGGHAKCADPA